jgi:uncharacterized protein
VRGAVAALLVLASCSRQGPPSTATPAPETAMTATAPATSGPRILMPDGTVYRVEVVADDEQRAQGLMFRDRLLPYSGMLFVFPEDGVYAFWMKNTLIPLDMIWIDASQTVVHVKHDVPPCRVANCPSYSPGVEARYVLELAAGEAKTRGLKPGDRLAFLELDDVAAR